MVKPASVAGKTKCTIASKFISSDLAFQSGELEKLTGVRIGKGHCYVRTVPLTVSGN